MSSDRWVVLLALAGVLSPWAAAWGLPPCGAPGTITTVKAPGGDYLAAFSDYTIYPPVKYETARGLKDVVAAPEYRSYFPQQLAIGPQGRIYVADQTIIYRLEADGTATRIVGVPQYSLGYDEISTVMPPFLQRFNVFQDTVAALDARIGPGAMTFDRHGQLYFVDYGDVMQLYGSSSPAAESRIARLEANGQAVTVAGPLPFGYISTLVFDPAGHLLIAGRGGIRRMDEQGVITPLLEADYVGKLIIDGQGALYFAMDNQVFRRHADGPIEHVAGSEWGDPHNHNESTAMRRAALEGEGISEERLGGYFVANGRPATEAPFHYLADMVLDTQGTLYIANGNFHRIHRVRPDGILETIAGNGLDSRFSFGCLAGEKRVADGDEYSRPNCQDHIGDGGSALEAPIWWPFRLLLTPEDDLLVAMSGGDYMWEGGAFSHLRRICRVSEWMVSPADTAVEQQAAADLAEEAVAALRLYPNPFNAAVTLAFELTHSASVGVRIYNELGQQVRVLAAEGMRPAGSYQFVWDGRDHAGQFQASGTYFLVLAVDGAVETHKLTLLH